MRLKSLKASSVRGIPRDWPELAFGQNGMIVYGPNGVGKSSIIDALEYGLTRKTTLYPVPRQGVNWSSGAPHVVGGDPAIAVELATGGSSVSLSADTDVERLADDQRAWIKAAQNASFVLRRHMLLRFITAEPRLRYDQIETFINLRAFLEIENALKDWFDNLETELETANADVTKVAARLRATFELNEDAAISEEALLGRLSNVLHELKLKKVSKREELDDRKRVITEQLGGKEQNERLNALAVLRSEAQQLGSPQEFAELLDGLIEALWELESEIKERVEAVLTDLLVSGKEAIEKNKLDECPLCEQPIERDAVLARLDERIAADERITAARELILKRSRALARRVSTISAAFTKFIEQWKKHMHSALPEAYARTLALLKEMEAALEKNKLTSTQFRNFVPRMKAAVTNHTEVTAQIDAVVAKEGGGERRTHLTSAAAMIDSFKSAWPKYEEAAGIANKTTARRKLIGRLYTHAIEARKAAVQATFNSVAIVANGYYERMHPGEGIATSSLEVRQTGQGSANLWTEFHGAREHPMLHYSESHLDTLGLAYFLALRKQEAALTPEFKVLVLDDVMHSVDAAHRGRTVELIRDEFSDHQIVVTTHDTLFYDAMRRDLGGGFKYYRITNWDIERGPVFGDPLTDFDLVMVKEVREKQSEASLAAAAGRFFEWLLREIAEELEFAVPFRAKRAPDIGILWPSVMARLHRQKGYSHQEVVERLNKNVWVRNKCGAHYNEPEAPVTLQEVRDFADGIAALYKSLYCGECKMFVTKRIDRSWRCDCNHLCYPKKVSKEEAEAS